MKTLHLSPDLALPLDVITMRMALYGTSGSGKTTFARLLAEKVHEAGHRFCAIDLKNDWWGLKSSADGSATGIPIVIFGGPRRDVQLFDDAGALVAETVTTIEQSVVVDLDDLSKGKQLRFLSAFLEKLYDANRGPLLLIADESDRYASQKPMSPEANITLGAAEDVCRRGRKRGIGSVWLTQRTAVLNKNVSDICDLTVVFRTPGERDLDELEDRIGRVTDRTQRIEVMKLAPGLEDGQAFFLSSHPKLRACLPNPVRPIQLPLPWTFDSSATPGLGNRRREPKVLAKADLAAIEQQMAVRVERAKADDPKALKLKIAELEKQLKAKAAPVPVQAAVTAPAKEVSVVKPHQVQKFAGAAGRLERAAEQMKSVADEVMASLAKVTNPEPKATASGRLANPQRVTAMPQQPWMPPKKAPPVESNGDVTPHEGITGPEQKILDAISWFETIGIQTPLQPAVAFFAGYTYGGGGFNNPRGRLKTKGLINYVGRGLALTPEGRVLAARHHVAPTVEKLHEKVMAVLPAPEAKLLSVLLKIYPASLDCVSHAEQSGYAPASGGYNNPRGRLRTAGLVEYPERGHVRACPLLFFE